MRIRWRGLELPSRVICNSNTLTETYGCFTVEPFERGFGHTIGNSLRRVLLSSLEGSAVTRIKIKNALHEYTPIKGVLEDVTEIVLNIKSLAVRSHDDKQKVIRIAKDKAGVITSNDIQAPESISIISKDHHIATLTDDVSFEMEMIVENGRGYVPVSEQLNSDRNEEIGYIPLDASFSPIVRVQYDISETRVGQKTNYDSLNLQIWTDGSIGPEIALVEGAKILRKHLNPFLQYEMLDKPVFSKTKTAGIGGADPTLEAKLNMNIADMGLSVRPMNCLENENIITVRDLVSRTEEALSEVRNFGEASLQEVKEKLNSMGLRLGMRLSS